MTSIASTALMFLCSLLIPYSLRSITGTQEHTALGCLIHWVKPPMSLTWVSSGDSQSTSAPSLASSNSRCRISTWFLRERPSVHLHSCLVQGLSRIAESQRGSKVSGTMQKSCVHLPSLICQERASGNVRIIVE